MSTVAGTITNPLEQIFVCTHPLTSYQEYAEELEEKLKQMKQ